MKKYGYNSGWRIITEKDIELIKEEENREYELLLNKEKDNYWKKNLFPMILIVCFIFFSFFGSADFLIYSSFSFHFILFLYFIIGKDFSFASWWQNIKEGGRFWFSVCFASLLLAIGFFGTSILRDLFPAVCDGFIRLKIDGIFDLVFFVSNFVFLVPIVEELFFRYCLISTEHRNFTGITLVLSLIFYGFSHGVSFWGIVITTLWALPLSIVYIKTRNVYLTITAHLFVNVIGVIPFLIFYIW